MRYITVDDKILQVYDPNYIQLLSRQEPLDFEYLHLTDDSFYITNHIHYKGGGLILAIYKSTMQAIDHYIPRKSWHNSYQPSFDLSIQDIENQHDLTTWKKVIEFSHSRFSFEQPHWQLLYDPDKLFIWSVIEYDQMIEYLKEDRCFPRR